MPVLEFGTWSWSIGLQIHASYLDLSIGVQVHVSSRVWDLELVFVPTGAVVLGFK